MAIKKGEKTAPRAAGKGPAFAGPSVGPAFSGAPLRVPAERGPWTYCASATRVQCLNGRIVAKLAKAWWTTGLNGNGRTQGRGEGYLAALEADDWTRIPHDIECFAFGEARRDVAEESTYLNRHVGVLGDREATYFTDAWTRPRQIGHLTTWERDPDGWADFLERCLKAVWPGELDEVQIRLAVDPVLRRLDNERRRDTSMSKAVVAACLRNLPPEYIPADLKGV